MTTTELAALLATPAAFRAWLEAKEPEEVVGEMRIHGQDPLSLFLKAHSPAAGIVVGWACVDAGAFDSHEQRIRVPEWAERFEAHVLVRSAPTITAAECLRILDEIEQRIYEEDMQELTDWEASMKHA
jgi:hypothetical protein